MSVGEVIYACAVLLQTGTPGLPKKLPKKSKSRSIHSLPSIVTSCLSHVLFTRTGGSVGPCDCSRTPRDGGSAAAAAPTSDRSACLKRLSDDLASSLLCVLAGSEGLGRNVNLGVNRDGEHRMGVSRSRHTGKRASAAIAQILPAAVKLRAHALVVPLLCISSAVRRPSWLCLTTAVW